MPKSKIIVHCLVCNEERFIWYALQSVLPFVNKIMVWDAGSDDSTQKIIQSIATPKIEFNEVGKVDAQGLTTMRQKMIEETTSDYDWLMYLDGDEIWTNNYLKIATQFVQTHPEYETVVTRSHNLVGDIYHRLPESAGRYHLAGRSGHLNLRFINLKRVEGLHVCKPHGQQSYMDSKDHLIQDRDPKRMKFLDIYFHHATHIQRSVSRSIDVLTPKRKQKLKYEIGEKIPKSDIPEVFFIAKPLLVPDVTKPASLSFWMISALLTLPRRIKRKFGPQ